MRFGNLIPTLGCMLAVASAAVKGAVEAPRIAKPTPAPIGDARVLPLPPAVFDNKLAIGGEDLKAREMSTRLTVEVKVNGSGPYHFVVDSGADTSAVGLHIANDLQLPLGTPAVLDGTTDRAVVDRVKVNQLDLGPTTVTDLQLPALREADLGGEGLIGIDALVEQRLMLDFDKHLIKVEDASKPPEFSPDDIVITAKRRRGQLILTEVRAGGMQVDAVIDTGSEISIGNLALRDKLLRSNPGDVWTVPATGVTGVTVNLQLANIHELQLGPVTLENVPIAFADVAPFKVFGLSAKPAMLVGTDLLSTFRRVSLDFRARKVRFQLRHCEDGVVISTSPSQSFTHLSSRGPDVCGREG